MGEYSDADLRVIRFLRGGKKNTTAVGKACFRGEGAAKDSGTRPAAAHLARMCERGLVGRTGSGYRTYWQLTDQVTDPGPDLFGETEDQRKE